PARRTGARRAAGRRRRRARAAWPGPPPAWWPRRCSPGSRSPRVRCCAAARAARAPPPEARPPIGTPRRDRQFVPSSAGAAAELDTNCRRHGRRGSGAGAEALQKVGVAGDDEEVVGADAGLGRGVEEVLTGGLHADDGDAVAVALLRLGQGEALDLLRRAHLDDGEAVLDLDVVEELAGHEVGDA